MSETRIQVERENLERTIIVTGERPEHLIGVEQERLERTIDVIREALTIMMGDLPAYTGATVVDPDFVGITLPTRNTSVYSDIGVNAIQVESVGNQSGGNTVYIGGII